MNSTARTSSSCAASATRSAARSARPPIAEYLLELCEVLNPNRIPGRLTLISRMGADQVEDALRPLLRAVTDAGHPVVWACDPMHGNTFTAPSGRKTRHFDDIVARDRRLRPGPPRRGHLARRHPRRAHRRERHRVPRWRRRRVATPTSTTATRRCATHGSTPARASTSPSGSPNSSATSPEPDRRATDGCPRPHRRLAGRPCQRGRRARRRSRRRDR